VASLFGHFLNNLPHCILHNYKNEIISAIRDDNWITVRHYLLQLPLPYRELIRLVMDLFLKIDALNEVNQMTIRNLGLCFGQTWSILVVYLKEHWDDYPSTLVYGTTLHEAIINTNDGIVEKGILPYNLKECFRTIEIYGLKEDDIYKESGSYMKIKEYRYRFNSGEKLVFKFDDVHNAASLVHVFYRDLKTPLFGDQLDNFLGLADIEDIDERTNLANECLSHLPVENVTVIVLFARHLKVIVMCDENKMDIESLCETLGNNYNVIFKALLPTVDNLIL